MANEEAKSANDLAVERTDMATERTDLAVERTVMAANRTLMAWVRTGLSLISFGFTIYKFLQAATSGAHAEGAKLTLLKVEGPRRLGLFLIALGTISVVMGALEYFSTIRHLNRESSVRHSPVNYSFIMGMAIGLLGLFLFVTIVLNKEVF